MNWDTAPQDLEDLRAQVVALEVQRAQYKGAAENLGEQLTAMTQERDAALSNRAAAVSAAHECNDQLAAAQAREAKLREAQWRNIKSVVKTLADWAFGDKDHPKYGVYWVSIVTGLTAKDGPKFTLEALATPLDDSALQARQKAERERCAERLEAVDGEWITKVAASALIRSLK